MKNIIPQILTKKLGQEPFHNYSPCPELYKGIMKTLFEKYFNKTGSSVATSSHWKEFGDKATINKDNFLALPYVDFDNLEFVQVINKK